MFKLSGDFQTLWELENSLGMNNSLGTNSNWRLSGAKKKKKSNPEGPEGLKTPRQFEHEFSFSFEN